MITVEYRESDWGGNIVFSREFYKPQTNDYLWLEAHECINGMYRIAHWVPDGMLAGTSQHLTLHPMLEYLTNYEVPKDMIEGSIPMDTFDQTYPE